MECPILLGGSWKAGHSATALTNESQRRPSLLLVDALNLIRRVYAAQPGEDGPERAEGAKAASVQSLRQGLRECTPTHAVCVFDGDGQSWRHELHPDYKAGHAPMPEALESALEGYREAFLEIGVASLIWPRLEADDVIATISCKAVEPLSYRTSVPGPSWFTVQSQRRSSASRVSGATQPERRPVTRTM